MTALALQLPEIRRVTVLIQALQAAQSIDDKEERAKALTALAPHLPEARRVTVLEQALQAAQNIDSERARTHALAALAPHLPEIQRVTVLKRVLQILQSVGNKEGDRAVLLAAHGQALAALMPYMSEELQEDALRSWVLAGSGQSEKHCSVLYHISFQCLLD